MDRGIIRVAEKVASGNWKVNDWTKKAILLYFPISENKRIVAGDLEFLIKFQQKELPRSRSSCSTTCDRSIWIFVESGAILMPSYVNIGAYVGSGTMIDTWATVGSCAQIGKNVHIAGGVGIGGVLEPPQAAPNIIEDNCFIGSRCIIVEGTIVEEEAVLGANVVITASTHIIDVTQSEPIHYKARIPARSVVIPGSYTKNILLENFKCHAP